MSLSLETIAGRFPGGIVVHVSGVEKGAERREGDFAVFDGRRLEDAPEMDVDKPDKDGFRAWLRRTHVHGTVLAILPFNRQAVRTVVFAHDGGYADFAELNWKALVKYVRLDLHYRESPTPALKEHSCPHHGAYWSAAKTKAGVTRKHAACPTCRRKREQGDFAASRKAVKTKRREARQAACQVTPAATPEPLPDLPPVLALAQEIRVFAPRVKQLAAMVRP